MFRYHQLFLIIVLFISGCTSESTIIETTQEVSNVEITHNPLLERAVATNQGIALRCQIFDFPISMSVDGQTTTIDNMEEFNAVITSYRFGVDFHYPISTASGDLIASPQDILTRYSKCIPKEGWSSHYIPYFDLSSTSTCVELSYPLILKDVEASNSYDSPDEVLETLAEKVLYFEFPFQLQSQDNQVVSIEEAEELVAAVSICRDDSTPNFDDLQSYKPAACFDLIFPQTFVTVDGELLMIDNYDDYIHKKISGEIDRWTFPLAVIDSGDHILIIENNDQWENATRACKDGLEGDQMYQLLINSTAVDNASNCYDLVYPISLLRDDFIVIDLHDDASVQDIVATWPGNNNFTSFLYPLMIRVNGTSLVFETYSELLLMRPDCD